MITAKEKFEMCILESECSMQTCELLSTSGNSQRGEE